MVNHFNYLSAFVSSYVMSGVNAKQRGYFLRHCIDILKAAVEIRNYHLVFGILSSIGTSHFLSFHSIRYLMKYLNQRRRQWIVSRRHWLTWTNLARPLSPNATLSSLLMAISKPS